MRTFFRWKPVLGQELHQGIQISLYQPLVADPHQRVGSDPWLWVLDPGLVILNLFFHCLVFFLLWYMLRSMFADSISTLQRLKHFPCNTKARAAKLSYFAVVSRWCIGWITQTFWHVLFSCLHTLWWSKFRPFVSLLTAGLWQQSRLTEIQVVLNKFLHYYLCYGLQT